MLNHNLRGEPKSKARNDNVKPCLRISKMPTIKDFPALSINSAGGGYSSLLYYYYYSREGVYSVT